MQNDACTNVRTMRTVLGKTYVHCSPNLKRRTLPELALLSGSGRSTS